MAVVPVTASVPGRRVLVLDALAARFGGTAYAVVQIAEALDRRDDVGTVVVVAQRDSIIGRSVTPTDAVRPLLLDAPAGRAELPWRAVWEATKLPGVAGSRGADLVVTFSGMLPRHPGVPIVSILANPVPFADRRGPANTLRRAAMARTRRASRATYVPSTGMQALAGPPATRVVPLGVDRSVFRPQPEPGRQLLYVADFYAHKRHDLLLEAWHRLAEPRPLLRLIGNPEVDLATFAAVRSAAAGSKDIQVDGRVSFAELLAAYSAARAVVLASERESFSMPLAEAVTMGIPAVIRDDAVLRETAGPGGLVVGAQTAAAWAAALTRIIRDDDLRAQLSQAGFSYGRRYSWDAFAEALVSDAA